MLSSRTGLHATLALVYVFIAASASAEIIYESAASGPIGQTSGSGYSVSSEFFLGVNFQVVSTVTTGSVGGHFLRSASDEPVFGAIVALDGPGDYPDTRDLTSDDVLGAALVTPPDPSDNVAGNLRLTLSPGWYALVFGSDRFGATGSAGALDNNYPDGISTVYVIRQSDGAIIPQADGARLFVDSAAVPTFVKIADTDTIVPGGTEVFTSLGSAAIRDGDVVFRGTASDEIEPLRQGLYTTAGGELHTIANLGTPLPGGTGTFTQLYTYNSISDGVVAFAGSGDSGQRGIYTGTAGALDVVVDLNMQIPMGTGTFTSLFSMVSIDEGDVSFTGEGEDGQFGVYAQIGGELTVVADMSTPLPGGEGPFDYIGHQYVPIDNGKVAFRGGSIAEYIFGIQTNLDGLITTVADLNTPIPGGTMTFGFFGSPMMRDGAFAFNGSDVLPDPTESGIYTSIGDELDVVADLTTPIPDGEGTFSYFWEPSFDGTHVAFLGLDVADGRGIYTDLTGALTKVIAQDDPLDGKAVSSLTIGIEAFDSNLIAFSVLFDDDSKGLYLAEYPPAPGDVDRDGDVDLVDFASFMECFGGSMQPPAQPDCAGADFSGDTDVDLGDLRELFQCLGGPDQPPACQ